MIIDELFEAPQMCPECGGISFSDLILAEKKDACYYKVKASAKVWPSAYASGRLVQCRKKGAANYGNKSESVAEGTEPDAYGRTGEKHECGSCDGTGIDTYDDECPECGGKGWVKDEQGVAEGWKGELAGGTIGGIAGNLAGSALGGPIGGIVGGAVGGAGGGIIGRELTKEEQLNEFAPVLAAGARLVIAMAPKIAQVIKNTGKATAKAAAPVAKSGAEIAAKNAGQIGVGLGAYEIGSSVADIAKDITAKVGTALEEKTVMELAQVAFKFAIPAGIVLAILYGGKKVIDSLFSDSKTEQGVAEGSDQQWVVTVGTKTGGTSHTMTFSGTKEQAIKQAVARFGTSKNPVVTAKPKQQGVAETRRGQIPMTLKPGETDNLEPEDFAGFKKLPAYQQGQAAQQKAGKQLIQKSPYTFQSDQDWAYRQGATDAQRAAMFANFGGTKPLTTAEGEQQPGADYRDPNERDYDGEYDAMVARVKRLAGLGPMKTVYDPTKRVYRNMPTAQQPKK